MTLLLPVAAMILVLDAYAVWFVRTEQTLYHADQVAYWSYCRSLAQLMVEDPVASVGAVFHSIANNDINLLPAVPISLLMVVFGGSRLVYVIGVITIYGFASCGGAGVRPGEDRTAATALGRTTGVCLVATVWQPVFIGYLGIGGVRARSGRDRPVMGRETAPAAQCSSADACGFLLAVLVLFRRWWGIWGVAFVAGHGCRFSVVLLEIRRTGISAVCGHHFGI